MSMSLRRCVRSRDREGRRIFVRQSCTHAQRACRSSDDSRSDLREELEMSARRRSRPRMGARERKDKHTSLMTMAGDVSTDEIV